MGLSATHAVMLLLVIVILFGRGKISDLMGEVGKGIRSFKEELDNDTAPSLSDAKQAAPELARPKSASEQGSTTAS